MLEDRQDAGLQARGRTVSPAACRVLLGAVIAVLIVGAYYPFHWDPPHTVHNQVTRTADGALRFGRLNRARTAGTPAWLAAAIRAGAIQIQLTADPRSGRAQAPMMLLGRDARHADFAIGQQHSALYVWLRRPGSQLNGAPPLVVAGVLQAGRWTTVDVAVRGSGVSISVDGRTRLTRSLPAGSLRGWASGQLALGAGVHGEHPWPGQIRTAEVRTAGYTVNYARPGALPVPASWLSTSGHILPFPPTRTGQWLLAFVDLLTFIPAGFLICWARRPPLHPAVATVFAALLAVALAAGKFVFHGRHTSLANVLAQVIGALLGALLAWHLAHSNRARWLPRPWPAGQPGPARKKTGV